MRKSAPWVVFGATDVPNKTMITKFRRGGVDFIICELVRNENRRYGDEVKSISDIDGEYVRLMFGRKESLYWFIRTLQNAYDNWEERTK